LCSNSSVATTDREVITNGLAGDTDDMVNKFERSRLSNVMDREKVFWKIGKFTNGKGGGTKIILLYMNF
jgi:hypothetical protein